MTRKMIVEEIKFPSYAVSYYEYGEPGDLTEEDIQNIEEFCEWTTYNALKGYHFSHIDYGDSEPSFSTVPVFGLPCDCYNAKVVYMEDI